MIVRMYFQEEVLEAILRDLEHFWWRFARVWGERALERRHTMCLGGVAPSLFVSCARRKTKVSMENNWWVPSIKN